MSRPAAAFVAIATLALAAPAPGNAQTPVPGGTLSAPSVRARGVAIPVNGRGAPAGVAVQIQRIGRRGWRTVARVRSNGDGRYAARVPQRPLAARIRLRAVPAGAQPTKSVRVRTRAVTLASVGDVNLGDGPGEVMARLGYRFVWSSVARELRGADLAFANLESAVSDRGRPVAKQFRFRGKPAALRAARTYAGLDVVNLANNHTGDYGTTAFLDTIRNSRRFGLVPVGAGRNSADALRPRVVDRLGLRVAFVGFSQILPAEFFAAGRRPGTAFASPGNVRAAVRRAARLAPVVVATFHWGVERDGRPEGYQRSLANTALAAGADAVVGAHPHVLQPIERRRGRKIVAFSLGNFVFASNSPGTTRTGILRLGLSKRGIEGARFVRARIAGVRPVLQARRKR